MPTTEQILSAYHGGADYSETAKRRAILRSLDIDPSGEHRTDDTIFGVPFVYCGAHVQTHATGWCTVGIGDKLPLRAQNREEAKIEGRALKLYQYGDDEQCTACEQLIGLNQRREQCPATKGRSTSAHKFARTRNF